MTGTDHPRRRRHRHDEVAGARAGRAAAEPGGGSRRSTSPTSTAWSRVGGDLEPGTLLAAYRQGLFPMPARRATARWAGGRPTPGASSRSTGSRVSRSLRRSLRRYEVRVDTAFADVVDGVRRPRPARRLDHRRRSARPTCGCTSSAGRTASRRGTTTGWPAGSTAWRSAGCSPASRCSTVAPTRRRWRSVALVDAARAPTATTGGCSTCSGRPTHLASLGVVSVPRRRLPRAASRPRSELPAAGAVERELSSRTGRASRRGGRLSALAACGRCPRRVLPRAGRSRVDVGGELLEVVLVGVPQRADRLDRWRWRWGSAARAAWPCAGGPRSDSASSRAPDQPAADAGPVGPLRGMGEELEHRARPALHAPQVGPAWSPPRAGSATFIAIADNIDGRHEGLLTISNGPSRHSHSMAGARRACPGIMAR